MQLQSKSRFAIMLCASLIGMTTMILSGCGGGGTTSAVATPGSASASKLFVVDEVNQAIGSVVNSNPSPGTITVDRIIMGQNTGLGTSIRGIAYDSGNNLLYVANGTSILVFNNANKSFGNIKPIRTITSTQNGNISGLSLDTLNNVLYVAVGGWGDMVLAYNNASTANGTLTPDRSIYVLWNSGGFLITDISFDSKRDILYVVGGNSNHQILAFDNASTLNGMSTVYSRAITITYPNTFLWGLYVDQINNRLYVPLQAVSSSANVMVFDNANSATSLSNLSRTLNLGGSASIRYVTVDATNDRLYATVPNGVYIVNGVSGASGPPTATFAMAPTGSGLGAVAVAP